MSYSAIDDPPARTPHREQLVQSFRGKYKHVSTSSDAFPRLKQEGCTSESLFLILNPAVGNAGAAREAQFHCASQLLRASPNG